MLVDIYNSNRQSPHLYILQTNYPTKKDPVCVFLKIKFLNTRYILEIKPVDKFICPKVFITFSLLLLLITS